MLTYSKLNIFHRKYRQVFTTADVLDYIYC